MPGKCVKGYSSKSIGSNISRAKRAGRPYRQALAISLSIAAKAAHRARKPGKAPKRKAR